MRQIGKVFTGLFLAEIARFLRRFDQRDFPFGELTHSADHFRMTTMTDQDDFMIVPFMAFRLPVHLADQWTGGVNIEHLPVFRFGGNGFCDPVSRKNYRKVFWDVGQLINKNSALPFQAFDDKTVVNNLMAYIDRCAIFFESPFDNLYRPIHPGAEPARCGETQCPLFSFHDQSWPGPEPPDVS